MSWTFLSNHGHVALQLSLNGEITMSEIANRLSITERRVSAIIRDLEKAGYVTVTKTGRRNTYSVNLDLPLRHDAESANSLGDLLKTWV